MRKTFAGRWLAALLTLALICSLAPASFADSTITLSPSTLSMRVGEDKTLTATVAGGTGDVTWTVTTGSEYVSVAEDTTSTNKTKCTVTAKKEGTATITATYDGKTATCKVAVEAPKIDITIGSLPTAIPVGSKEKLTAAVTVNGKTETNPTISWDSDNHLIAKIVPITEGTTTVEGVEGVASGTTTITATYQIANTDYKKTATYAVKVVSASVKSLALTIDNQDGSTADKTAKKETSVGGSVYAEVKVAPKWSNTATGGTEREFTEGEKKRLEWSAEVVSGSEFIRLPYTKGTGIPDIRVDGVKPTGANEKATVKVKVTYTNIGGGVAKAEATIPFEVTVTSTTQVIITEYAVETREVTLIKGGSSKTLQAYIVENGRWKEDDNITWTLEKTGVVSVTPNKDKVTVAALAEGSVKLTATHTPSGKTSTVTCVVKTESSGGDPGGEDPDKPPAGDTLPDGVTASVEIETPSAETDGVHLTDPGTENIKLNVTFTKGGTTSDGTFEWSTKDGGFAVYTDGTQRYVVPISWKSSNDKIVKVNVVVSGDSGRYVLMADQPGEATLTVSVPEAQPASLKVAVKGFSLKADKFELYENGSMELKEAVVPYGGADANELTCWSNDSTIAAYVAGKIEAYKPGTTTFTVSDPKRGFRASFDVTVKADPNATIDYGTLHAQTQKFLSFSDLLSSFRRQAGGKLSHITGVNMASSGGDLYYKYNSTTGAGTGVGAENYYHPYRAGGIPYGQRSLEDLTFVPKKGYAGQVTINYTGVSEEGKNYVCQLLVTVDPESGSDAGISLTTPYNTALRLNGDDFNRVCRERLGVKLDHVVFSQPPERQGTLYTDYVGPGNYGKVVSPSTRYSLKQLDDIWFVPAPGFSGTVTLYYTAYGTGTNAGSFAGQAVISVGREDGVAIGGLTFDTVRGSAVRFDDERFNSYCREVLQEESWYDRQTLSRVRFDALPDPGEGVLFYDYRSSSNTGTRAETGTTYYYGTRDPRIDRLTFVPAANFIGTVKIPFTGWTSDGTSFTGNVEVNVRGGTGHGDILYVCAPGRSVSFRSSDFASLSRDLTGRTISYIIFRDLPGSSDGSLYYNNSRITTTGARYQNSSIGRLSFRASNSFSGAVDIPFEGQSTSGETFSGVVTISTSSSGGSGSSSGWGNIRYTSRDGAAAVFDRYDFDSMSQWYNREDVSSVRFQAPASTWGDLYRNYRSSSNPGTRIISSANIARGGLDQVAFVPAGSYTGTVYIDFTAVSDDGSTFSGTVEIAVERSTWNIPTTVPTRFSDVASNAYYADAVKWAVSNGITSGTSSTTFSPHQTCTVAQILSFLYRANGSPKVTGSNPFTDVRTSDYYYEAALWARQKGLVSGSAFHPFSPCTRSMVVTYLWKLAGQPAAARPISYSPYTLTGSREYQIYDEQIGTNISRRSSFTLRFDAAATAKTRITLHHDYDELGYIRHDFELPETYDVTVIAVRPGSSYTIDGGFYGFSYMSEGSTYFNGVPGTPFFRAGDGTFRRTLTQMGHDDSEFALYENSLSWFRENGAQSSIWGNNGSRDCGVLIQLNGAYYFVTYADSATAAGLMSGTTGFSDVPANASYAQAVAWATEQKITSGTSKTTFSPDKICTRGQIVTFLYRAMGW